MNEQEQHTIHTEGEPILDKDLQEELRQLRIKAGNGEISEEERQLLLELQEKEEKQRGIRDAS